MNTECYYRVSVKGIAIDEQGRLLLTREDNGKWELLGGGLEHGEDPIAALHREIHEETGLTVTAVGERPRYFITVPRWGHDTYVANVVYHITLQNLDFVPSDECQELGFFSLEEAAKLDLFPNVERLLEVMQAEKAR